MNKNEELWKLVLKDIKSEVSFGNFNTLFKKTELLSVDDSVATIAASSTILINLLQKRFSTILKTTLDKHTGKNLELLFVPRTLQKAIKNDIAAGPLFGSTLPTKTIGHLPRVRSEYTFDNLAVSGSNQLAFVSCQTVAKNLGTSYNPLFIYGPVGVGKTHLMQAIANEVFRKTPEKIILYITSEEFTNEVVEAIRTNDTSRMKKKFRSADLLIIDDIQFIAGKDRVQEELFHTFNILIDNGQQIVLSSDRPPSEIKKLESRLSSRFAGGLTVDIEPPDFELKTAILLIKAKKFNVDLDMEVAKAIADKAMDTRSLEGMLLRVVTQAATKNEAITEDLVKKVLSGQKEPEAMIRPDDIIKHICDYYHIKTTQLKGPKRDASLVKVRHIVMYILKIKGLTHNEIGNLLGGRDHTTVMHGVEKMENFVERRTGTYEEIMGITKSLRA